MNRPGTWCDVAQNALVYCHNGWVTAERRDGWQEWQLREPEPGGSLYLRCARLGERVYAIVQGHDTGTAYWTWGGEWVPVGLSFGQNAVLMRAMDGGVRVWVQRSPTSYDTWMLGDAFRTAFAMPETSQGFLDYRDHELLLTDVHRFDAPLVLPNYAGAVAVGQVARSDGLYARLDGRTIRVAPRPAFEPHVVEDTPGHWVACARSTNHRFVVVKLTRRRWATAAHVEPPG